METGGDGRPSLLRSPGPQSPPRAADYPGDVHRSRRWSASDAIRQAMSRSRRADRLGRRALTGGTEAPGGKRRLERLLKASGSYAVRRPPGTTAGAARRRCRPGPRRLARRSAPSGAAGRHRRRLRPTRSTASGRRRRARHRLGPAGAAPRQPHRRDRRKPARPDRAAARAQTNRRPSPSTAAPPPGRSQERRGARTSPPGSRARRASRSARRARARARSRRCGRGRRAAAGRSPTVPASCRKPGDLIVFGDEHVGIVRERAARAGRSRRSRATTKTRSPPTCAAPAKPPATSAWAERAHAAATRRAIRRRRLGEGSRYERAEARAPAAETGRRMGPRLLAAAGRWCSVAAGVLSFALLRAAQAKPALPGGAQQSAAGEGFFGTLALPAKPAPPIDLRNYLGQRVTLGEYRGRAVLVTFLYTNCPDVCPLITSNLRVAPQPARAAGRAGADHRRVGRPARGHAGRRRAVPARPRDDRAGCST